MLRPTRQITWTTPPNRADTARLAEIEEIDATPAEQQTPEAQQRRQQLAAELAPAEQTRITLSTLSALQAARYEGAKRQVRSWMEEVTGRPTAEAIDNDDGRRLFQLGLGWARFYCTVTKIETRTAARLDDGGKAGRWKDQPLPPAWETPAGFLDDVPADLANALKEAAGDLNPGIFYVQTDEEAKKNGGISVE